MSRSRASTAVHALIDRDTSSASVSRGSVAKPASEQVELSTSLVSPSPLRNSLHVKTAFSTSKLTNETFDCAFCVLPLSVINEYITLCYAISGYAKY